MSSFYLYAILLILSEKVSADDTPVIEPLKSSADKNQAECSDVSLTLNDMKFTPEQEKTMKLKNAYVRTAKWPNGVIPYTMNSEIANDPARRSAIENSIRIYSDTTCIRWVRRTNEMNYVEFMDGGARQCYSAVGLTSEGKQIISIGKGCENSISIVMHEMMHTAGFMHEHMRPDRDSYITVVNSKIVQGMHNQFTKLYPSDVDQQSLRYDYLSIMHYPPNAFSTDGSSTIVTKDPTYQNQIGQRNGFSKCDLEKLNKWYGCTNKLTNDKSCQIDGGVVEPTVIPPSTGSTVIPPITPPIFTEQPNTCTDNNPFVCYNAKEKCLIYPGYYLFQCKRTCDNCNGNKCQDTNMFWWQAKCSPAFKSACMTHMQRILCPKSCGLC